jgi:hypothetical protein
MYYNQQNNNSIKKIRTKNTPGFLVFVNIASKYQPKIAGRPSAWRPSNNNGLANRFKNLNNNFKSFVLLNVNNRINENVRNAKKASNAKLNARYRIGYLKKPTTARPSTKRR